jgi:hypothetical protein
MKMYPVLNSTSHHEDVGNGHTASSILNLSTRWRWVVNFTPSCFTPGERGPPPQYPLERRLGGSHSQSGHGGEEKKIPVPAKNQTLGIQHTALSLLTELPQLLKRINRSFACNENPNNKWYYWVLVVVICITYNQNYIKR